MNKDDKVDKVFKAQIRTDVELVISNHLAVERKLINQFSSELLDRAFLRDWWVYDKPKDLEALKQLGAAISKIERIYYHRLSTAANDTLSSRMAFGPHFDAIQNGGDIHKDSDQSQRLDQYLEETGKHVSSAILNLLGDSHLIRNAIALTKTDIENSPSSRKSTARMNLVGIQLVEAARFIWKQAKGIDAPAKDLNIASAFGKFLADIFDACEVEGDVRSAFRAWAKENASTA